MATPFVPPAPIAVVAAAAVHSNNNNNCSNCSGGGNGGGGMLPSLPHGFDSRHPGALPSPQLNSTPRAVPGGLPAAFPANEDDRVAALLDYKIMDTQAESAFDQLAVLASQICQTPIALVSLVDHERQVRTAHAFSAVSEECSV